MKIYIAIHFFFFKILFLDYFWTIRTIITIEFINHHYLLYKTCIFTTSDIDMEASLCRKCPRPEIQEWYNSITSCIKNLVIPYMVWELMNYLVIILFGPWKWIEKKVIDLEMVNRVKRIIFGNLKKIKFLFTTHLLSHELNCIYFLKICGKYGSIILFQ